MTNIKIEISEYDKTDKNQSIGLNVDVFARDKVKASEIAITILKAYSELYLTET